MTRAPTLMVQGTGSGVGKSWLVTGLCRLFRRRGMDVRPFKAQNMSNNAAVTAAGGEIGRAQAIQAMAAGVEAEERMNPVLLKPLSDSHSDVVLLGRSRPELASVPWRERRDLLWGPVIECLEGLRAECDLVVMEGAGSPAETNLRDSDIVNMEVARASGAPVLLVADIDRGGAFASLYGTWALLAPEDQAYVKGFVLNRFRGDPSLLDPAPADLTSRTGVPVLGVIPFVRRRLPEEDAATLERLATPVGGLGQVRVAAVHFPRLANFDDLAPIEDVPGVEVEWIQSPERLVGVNAVVLPGTRNTLGDLAWLNDVGLGSAIRRLAREGVPVLGICGGFQMLGDRVQDPIGLESCGSLEGLGLLPIRTCLEPTKVTRRTKGTVIGSPFGVTGITLEGYEIHHGRTTVDGTAQVWLSDEDDPTRVLGVREGSVAGTYLHGLFTNDAFREAWLGTVGSDEDVGSWDTRMAATFEALADSVEAALGFEALLKLIDRGAP